MSGGRSYALLSPGPGLPAPPGRHVDVSTGQRQTVEVPALTVITRLVTVPVMVVHPKLAVIRSQEAPHHSARVRARDSVPRSLTDVNADVSVMDRDDTTRANKATRARCRHAARRLHAQE